MHPLWNLLPLLICFVVLVCGLYCTIADWRAGTLPKSVRFWALITLAHVVTAAGGSVSLAPVLAWTLGRTW